MQPGPRHHAPQLGGLWPGGRPRRNRLVMPSFSWIKRIIAYNVEYVDLFLSVPVQGLHANDALQNSFLYISHISPVRWLVPETRDHVPNKIAMFHSYRKNLLQIIAL